MSAPTVPESPADNYEQKYGWSDPTDSYLVKMTRGLGEGVVKEISRLHDEPAWMEHLRLQALKHFFERGPPAWAPELAKIDFQSFSYYAKPVTSAQSWDQLPVSIRETYDKLGIPEAEKRFLAGVGAVYECLSARSKVFTTRGLISIVDIDNSDTVFSWDENGDRIIQVPVRSTSYKGKRPVFEVKTENDSILATDKHPFLVLSHVLPPGHKRRGFWAKEWKYLSELRVGDVVIVPKAIPILGNPHAMAEPEIYTTTISHNQFGASYVLDISHLYNSVSFPRESTSELMWFLGLFVGDGLIHSATRASGRTRARVQFLITTKEPALRQELISIGYKTFGLSATLSDDVVSFNSTPLAGFLNLNGFQTGAKTKSLPKWVFTLPRDQILAFLAGVIDSDGYAAPAKFLDITSSNRTLLDGLRDLCRFCGFPVSKVASFKGRDKYGETTNYRFYIYGEFEAIPCKNPQRTSIFWKRKFVHTRKGAKGFDLRKYLSEDTGVARITSIRSVGSEDVYDIEINGPHNFVAEGFIVHNSEAVYHSIQEKLQKQGVIFTDTVTALKEYPELMKKYFGTIVPYKDNYIAALQTAIWSAGSFVHVPEGVKVPMPLTSYFRINTKNIAQAERTLIIAEPGSEVNYIEGCLPKDEMVSTGEIMKPISEVGIGDRVLSHEGKPATVVDTMSRPYRGKLITITPFSAGNSFSLTPEHPVLCVRRAPISNSGGKGRMRRVVRERLAAAKAEYVLAGKLERGDFLVYPIPTEVKESEDLTVPVLRLLGLYLAEGWVADYNFERHNHGNLKRYSYPDYVVKLGFGRSSKERHLALTAVELIRSLGGKASMCKSGNKYYGKRRYYEVASYYKPLIRLCLKHCGSGAGNKRLSAELMLLPPEKQKILLDAYMLGDGDSSKTERVSVPTARELHRAVTTSGALAYQIQELLARRRMFARITIRKPFVQVVKTGKLAGTKIDHSASYTIKRYDNLVRLHVKTHGDAFLVPIRKIARSPYNGRVYNLRVRSAESYLVKGFAVHNCSAPVYSSQSLHTAVVEIVAKERSFVKYTTLQNWSRDVLNLVTKRAHAYEESTVSWVDANVGSRITHKYPSVFLMGRRAKADIISVAYAGAGQYIDSGGKVVHLASDTSSKIVARSVSKNGGRTAYRGLIFVHPKAENVKVASRCDAILLDQESSTATYPYEEVSNPNATVNHEASCGSISDAELFYMESRGLSETDALSMIVNGFLEPFAKELPMTYAVEFNRLIQLEVSQLPVVG